MSGVTGLAGVIVWTAAGRFEPMRRFYLETLGLLPRSDRPGMINFDWSGIRLTVAVHSEVSGASREPLRVMINLGVDDIDGMHERLMAAGVGCLRSPSYEPWGGRVASYRDPDGNVVQLLELPGSAE
ncbi:MAG: VOC family protein [Acidimicrobiia bacterium]|nr:VOC family protein [Acidimicrobiia bacterium]